MLTRRDAGALVLMTLMWGVNWPVMKFALREVSPLWLRALTMGGGALTLAAWYAHRGVPLTIPRHEWPRVAWLALPNIVLWHGLSVLGLQLLASGRAAILGFTMPVWTVLLSVLLKVERMTPRIAVAAVAACGAVALLSAQEFAQIAGRPLGVLWMQVGAFAWAAGTLMLRHTRTTVSNEALTVGMMGLGAAAMLLAALAAEPAPAPSAWRPGTWAAIAYIVLLNYGYAQVLWFGMARRLPPSASAFSIMAVPMVGTLAATVVVGERPHVADGLAAVAVAVAILSALRPARRPASGAAR
jgi:drug/metabolite transporter (DMT)-like permease